MGTRKGIIKRKTNETEIEVILDIDGSGLAHVETGVPFLDHMLTLFARHGFCDLTVKAKGDIEVDDHHTVEDIGICIGLALKDALGEKERIKRYGTASIPMDEALVMATIDLCGRSYLNFQLKLDKGKVGNFDIELVEEFFRAFVNNATIVLHLNQLAGKNYHHIIEATFKAFGRALDESKRFDERLQGVPSTKGRLV